MNIIVGYEKEKNEVKELQKFLLNLNKYRKIGVRIPRGVIFVGEPGVGKTSLAKSIICDGIELIEVRAADCCDENATILIQNAFAEAKEKAPTVVLLDELDKIAGEAPSLFMEGNDNIKKLLLREIDKLADNDGILVVATCNDLNCIGYEMIRSGRFDRILHISNPSEEERKQILTEYCSRIRIKKSFKIEDIARMTPGYTGAELECIVNESGIMTLSENNDTITLETVRKVMNKQVFQSSEGIPLKDDDSRYKVAVHEAGHALVGMLTMSDSVYGVSILPQGFSNGHIQIAGDEAQIPQVSDLENKIAMTLAGRIAEREILGSYNLGSSSDLSSAAKCARTLIVDNAAYGYESVGALSIDRRSLIISNETMAAIENKIAELLQRQDERVTEMINANKAVLQSIVCKLLEQSILSRDELTALFLCKAKTAA